MKAVRLHGVRDLRFEEVDAPPSPGPGEILLDVEAAGICGSDLHNFSTGQWISRSPSIAGHEFCGRVAAVGQGVSGFARGDAVVADSRYWCGECENCRAGDRNACVSLGFVGEVCDGGFAEQVLLPARLVLRRPDDLPANLAAMSEPLAVALHALGKLAVEPGAPVLVVGCGTIGGLCALALSRRHDRPILLADRNFERAAAVAEATSGRVVALDKQAIADALDGEAIRFAIDATGSIAALQQTIELMGANSRLVLVGISHGKLDLDPNVLVEREIALLGSHAFKDELPDAIAMAGELSDVLPQFINGTVRLEEVPDAFQRLLTGQAKGLKTIIEIA
ncbi:MAG: alcohol dehydrogenase catalytic domain-containing protein [Candidatus Devosia phytovorans]|uniref:Alcohol dehydrogenase catalytic domain-containing protein n=1 Tax=Candidatus Devosia phytovorans TaxID=3121372 RepID=A0AAJ5VU84_9HYPH|nr:alcohol dehydrogenase catalytic domain-containing protein [Devosia sp.]WEK04931.1 MAG: alcohol dehydrogenase catalytic domain-containing protein [Devosia sp.]